MSLVGRIEERQRLDQLLTSVSAEFIAIYGRRRVGKTYLVREHFKKQLCFELTGVLEGSFRGSQKAGCLAVTHCRSLKGAK